YTGPDRDWAWLKGVKARLERRVQPRRAPHMDSGRLLDLGIRLMDGAIGVLPSRQALLDYRDGLIIAFLAFRPLRRRTFAVLTIGRQLRQIGTTWMIVLSPDDLKNHRDAEFTLPEMLVPYLARYLEEVRPIFFGSSNHPGLWPSAKGRPMSG